jgi:hypothetical protein
MAHKTVSRNTFRLHPSACACAIVASLTSLTSQLAGSSGA